MDRNPGPLTRVTAVARYPGDELDYDVAEWHEDWKRDTLAYRTKQFMPDGKDSKANELAELADLEAAGILDKSVYYAAKAKLIAEEELGTEQTREEARASQDAAQREGQLESLLDETRMTPSPAPASQVSHEGTANVLARVAARTAEDDANAPSPRSASTSTTTHTTHTHTHTHTPQTQKPTQQQM